MRKHLLSFALLLAFVPLFAQQNDNYVLTFCQVANMATNEQDSLGNLFYVLDHEGKRYHVLQVGNQCWMRENLRTYTSPSTGTHLVVANATANDFSYTGKKAYHYNNNPNLNGVSFGILYNWCAAVDSCNNPNQETATNTEADSARNFTFVGHRRGICPQGWHLPTGKEWQDLAGFYASTSGKYAHILADDNYWLASVDANTPGDYQNPNRASSHFDALPAGLFCPAGFSQLFKEGLFWASTQQGGYGNFSKAQFFRLNYDKTATVTDDITLDCPAAQYFYSDKQMGYSVRCVRDIPCISPATTHSIVFMANGGSGMMYNQTITADVPATLSTNNYTKTNHLFVGWNTRADGHGDYFANEANVTFNHNMVLYAQWKALTDKPCTVAALASNELGTGNILHTVLDHEGNAYAVVQMGNQCWLKENMRCISSPSTGTLILETFAHSNSYTGKKAYYYNNDPHHADNGHGLLYNWNAAVDTFNTAFGETSTNMNDSYHVTLAPSDSSRRGICPEGWHLPTSAEWNTVIASAGVSSESGANRMTTGNLWTPSSNATAPGNYSDPNRNISGFSAIPCGIVGDAGVFGSLTSTAYFWHNTTNQSWTVSAYITTFDYRLPNVLIECYQKYIAGSVRCLRDE